MSVRSKLKLILVFSFVLSVMISPAQALTTNEVNITTAFRNIQNVVGAPAGHVTPKWPVAASSTSAIESAFGVRIQNSTGKYDWHRGIDIDAALNTDVKAAETGELWKVYQYPNSTYPDGGNVVILRHKFGSPVVYNGKTLTYYYTLYMHLNSINQTLINAFKSGVLLNVKAGDLLGKVGHTGEPNIADHLHFELRVGTYCTLEFQVANSNSSCSKGYMYDPAMNPLLLFAPPAPTTTAVLSTKPTSLVDGKVHISMSDAQTLLNRVEFSITNASNVVVKSSVLDFDERTGFNATSTSTLDTPDKTKPYFSPLIFNDASLSYQMDVIIPKAFISGYDGVSYKRTLTVEDIWGNRVPVKW